MVVEAEPLSRARALPLDLPPGRVIGIAASAGGVEALRRLVAQLPEGLDAAVCIVLHIPPTGRSLLAPILDRDSAFPTVVAEHGAPLRSGTIYVAPADRHLLIRSNSVELSRGPKENGVRPAADPMFRSLARSWGDRAIAIVLSGALDDGAAGAAAVALAGGRVIVQDPADALVGGMPSATLAVTTPDDIVPIAEMGDALRRLTTAGPGEDTARAEPDPAEVRSRPEPPGRLRIRLHVPGVQRRPVGDSATATWCAIAAASAMPIPSRRWWRPRPARWRRRCGRR